MISQHRAENKRLGLLKIAILVLVICVSAFLSACAQDRDLRQEQSDLRSEMMPEVTSQPGEPGPGDEQEAQNPADETLPEPGSEPDAEATPENTPEPVPTTTSKDLQLYAVDSSLPTGHIVNAYGLAANGYALDSQGNILDRDQKIVVAAANCEEFRAITGITFSADKYSAELTAKEETVDGNPDITTVNQYPVYLYIPVTAAPQNATCNVLVVFSSDPSIVSINANENKKILADGNFALNQYEVAVAVPEDGKVTLVVSARSYGEATLTVKSINGSASSSCTIKVADGVPSHVELPKESDAPATEMINASTNPQTHTHEFKATVVDPTYYEQGYTVHTCDCGYSFTDSYVPRLPIPSPEPTAHVHSYRSVVVAPTETERGYTLHTCDCGDSYKDSYTSPLG